MQDIYFHHYSFLESCLGVQGRSNVHNNILLFPICVSELAMKKKKRVQKIKFKETEPTLMGIRMFKTFTLASPKADVIPIWYLMLVDTDRASTGLRTCIELRYATDSKTSIRDRVL